MLCIYVDVSQISLIAQYIFQFPPFIHILNKYSQSMYKVLLCLVLALPVFSQPILQQGLIVNRQQMLVGGFSQVDPQGTLSQEQLQMQKKVDDFARKHFSNSFNGEQLVSLEWVQRQIVAGQNYKLHYKRSTGNMVVITIYRNLQDTLLVTNVEHKVEKN